jgi:hypothetical protein
VEIGGGRGFSAYYPKLVNEVGNFNDFFPISLISSIIVTAKLIVGDGW